MGPLIWGSRPNPFSRDQEALHLGATQLPKVTAKGISKKW